LGRCQAHGGTRLYGCGLSAFPEILVIDGQQLIALFRGNDNFVAQNLLYFGFAGLVPFAIGSLLPCFGNMHNGTTKLRIVGHHGSHQLQADVFIGKGDCFNRNFCFRSGGGLLGDVKQVALPNFMIALKWFGCYLRLDGAPSRLRFDSCNRLRLKPGLLEIENRMISEVPEVSNQGQQAQVGQVEKPAHPSGGFNHPRGGGCHRACF